MHFFPVRYLLIQSIVTPWHNRVNYSMETHFDKAHSWARQNIPFPQNPHLFSEGQCRFDVMCGQSLRVEISLSLRIFWDWITNYHRVTKLRHAILTWRFRGPSYCGLPGRQKVERAPEPLLPSSPNNEQRWGKCSLQSIKRKKSFWKSLA